MSFKTIVVFDGIEKEIVTENKTILLSLLQEVNIPMDLPCGGKGLCGKCRVKVLKGELAPNSSDVKFFNEKELQEGYRLACTHRIDKDLTIEISSSCNNFEICTIFGNEMKISTRIKHYVLEFDKKILVKYKSCIEYIKNAINKEISIVYDALLDLGCIIDKTVDEIVFAHLYILDNDIIKISLIEEEIYGIAVDIGTTTIAMALINLVNGEVIDTYSSMNLQNKYGYDVISRIDYASQSESTRKIISTTIKEVIEEGFHYLMNSNDKSRIYLVGLSGNTTMIQLLLELSSRALSLTPFLMLNNEILEFNYSEIFKNQGIHCKVIIVPSISAYVGGDITSGIVVTDIVNSNKINLLIDIGTNGEMVLGNNEMLLCTATAAGPAFEGAKIKHGLGAIDGAISAYGKIDGKIQIKTIRDKAPIGICGTGIIDIISQLVKDKLIDYTGLLLGENAEGEEFVISNKNNHLVTLTRQDVREIQLAKSAIRSGIEVLINRYGCKYEDINKVYIAGGFGSKIRLESAVDLGLLPKELKDKAESIGNASLAGCIQLLVNKSANDTYEKIIEISKLVELSSDIDFNNYFMEYMFFEI